MRVGAFFSVKVALAVRGPLGVTEMVLVLRRRTEGVMGTDRERLRATVRVGGWVSVRGTATDSVISAVRVSTLEAVGGRLRVRVMAAERVSCAVRVS